jgi:hypothetical protein
MAKIPNDIRLRPASVHLPYERRQSASRHALLQRVYSEFEEMPGLCLTTAQASRLFHLRGDVCNRVFSELVHEGLLCLTAHGQYRLRDNAA